MKSIEVGIVINKVPQMRCYPTSSALMPIWYFLHLQNCPDERWQASLVERIGVDQVEIVLAFKKETQLRSDLFDNRVIKSCLVDDLFSSI